MLEDLLANKHKLTTQISDLRKQMEEHVVQGDAGAGGVKVTMNGLHEVIRVEIDQDLMDDKEVLEDLIAAALNDANRRVVRQSADFIGEGSMNFMDMFK